MLVKQKALEKKGKAAQAAAAKAERHGKRVAAALKAKAMRALRKDAEREKKEAYSKSVAKEKKSKERKSKQREKEKGAKAIELRNKQVAAMKSEKRAKSIAKEKKRKEKGAKVSRQHATKSKERNNKRVEKTNKQRERSTKAAKERMKKAQEQQAKSKARAAAAAARRKAAAIKARNCRISYWTTHKWYAGTDCCRGCDGRSPAPGGMRGQCYRRNKLGWATSKCDCRATPRGSFQFKTSRYYFGVDCSKGCRAAGASLIHRSRGAFATSVCTCRLSC